ncbi:MAG: glycosyltransferase [Candidatus Thiodiazotropha sp. (ex Dulcina madagascariensis)]|nr:glycosyltransferase [Candidatus Thiodiazotropha sp. (ex Dulcina madagascariensis)]MCU7926369.1 glycosyltransferase [Candidatus Thiodiazotropha sp. (ex Dulcina madagascariensis)]
MSLSVIIPTHNRRHTLPRALDSVLVQSFSPLEIIVVDDGSDDGTRRLIENRYPQCGYFAQPNQGVSSARNLGIQQAQGEWIAFLDSDDCWLPDKLRRQIELVGRSAGHRLCHTDEIWIRNDVRVNQMDKHAKSGGHIFQRCLALCVISPSSVMLHRSLFDEFGLFDPELPACEDYDLWLRICSREPVLFIDEPLIMKYGGHDDQLSRHHWGMDRFRVYALRKLLDNQDLQDNDRAAAVETLLMKCGILAQGAEKRGHLERAAYYRTLQQRYQAE